MNYELAKKLKDAGFPFNWGNNGDEMIYGDEPSLLELIRACGRDFKTLTRQGDTIWLAQGSDFVSIDLTPDMAVANLWLKLNEKR